ncbi:Deoxyribonuclease-2-alpha, partial [Trichinella nativa]
MQNHLQLLVHFILILFSQSQNPNPKCRANDGNAEGNIIQSSRTDQRQNPRFKERRCMGGWKRGPYTTRTTVVWSYTRTCCRESRSNKIPCIQQCSTKNDQRVIIVQTTPGTDAASWIVHTVPGFPAAKTGYSWPVAENAKGHLLICLTISESQINAIAASLLRAEPLVHYNDIPETETVGMQYFKKLSDGQFPTVPPYLSRQSIKTAGQPAVTVNVYSKSATSRYEIYKRVIVKALKKTIKVWSRRDNKLKGDCRVVERNIRLIKSPARVGVIIVQTTQNIDAASWIVHTVPGFPAAKTGYSWPVAENAKGHILICLTISESQINAIAASLLRAEPLVHYNDIPETETVGMQYFKKLSDGQFPTVPPYLSRQSIKTAAQAAVTVNVYSKSATSRYEIYKRVIVKALKKTIKVWSRRDNKLKGDCRVVERNIRLIKSPARVGNHDTNLDADLTNWAVSDPGNIFCLIDRPYAKNQTVQSAMAVCIDQAAIFARFNDIAAQVEDCPRRMVSERSFMHASSVQIRSTETRTHSDICSGYVHLGYKLEKRRFQNREMPMKLNPSWPSMTKKRLSPPLSHQHVTIFLILKRVKSTKSLGKTLPNIF